MDNQEQNQVSAEPEESAEDIAALFRGEDIADEVDTPPPPKRQAKAVAPADPEPDSEDAEDEEADEPLPGLDFLKKSMARKSEALNSRLAELESELEELRPKAKRGTMSIQDILDDDDSLGLLSQEEKQYAIQRLFADLYPDKATPEDQAEMARIKYAREQKRINGELSRKEEEMRQMAAQAKVAETVGSYRAEVKEYIADNFDQYPTVMSVFGDRKNAAAAVLAAAEIIAQSGQAESDEEITPERILAQLEEEYSREQKKTQKSAKPKQRSRAVPVAEELNGDDELEEMARLMRGI